jgi:predicted amino acid-binding ACT domain protein
MTDSHELFVISIISRDRIGIIYEVTRAISELEGNIADVRQSVLCGYFTMILLASFPPGVSQRSIERKLAEADSHSESAIEAVVRKADENTLTSAVSTPENAYVLTATGQDRVGFVALMTSFCVKHNINILVIDLNHCASISDVRHELQQFSQENNIKAVLQHYDIFRALHEINLPIR